MTAQLPDLAAIAQEVRWPPVDPQDDARASLAAAGMDIGYGRLADLAVWWASVRDDARADEGTDLLLVAADDPAARLVLAAAVLGLGPVEALGWPQPEPVPRDSALAGQIDDARWMDDVVRLRDGLRRVRGSEGEPVPLLRAVGSPMLAAATGLVLQAAARRTPVILDGPGAAAAGLLARGQAWEAPDWWLVVGRPGDVLHERALGLMRMTELPVAPVAVEDGTGALLAADLLAAAAALLVAAPPAPRPPIAPDDAAEDGAEPGASQQAASEQPAPEQDPDVAGAAPHEAG